MLDEVKEGVLFMKTHELEKELGISKHTIFYYEKEGIVTPQRDANGYRSYNQDDLQKLIMVKFLRNLNISIDDVKAILNNELDFKECLEINQIHLEKQIKSLEEVQENIEMYVRKDLPMLPALQQIQREAKNYKLGYQKTTDTVSLGRRLTKKLALRKFLYKIPAAITPSFIMWICAASFFDENLEKTTALIIIFILLMILFINIFVATEFQFSQIWLKNGDSTISFSFLSVSMTTTFLPFGSGLSVDKKSSKKRLRSARFFLYRATCEASPCCFMYQSAIQGTPCTQINQRSCFHFLL